MVYQWNKYRTKSLNKQVKRLRISHKKINKINYLCNLLILSIFL
ncbi:unknown [Odoribacter splanchnicus CAG:14]|nr:unknown [Odoribacter splanchnicus CAG:14]